METLAKNIKTQISCKMNMEFLNLFIHIDAIIVKTNIKKLFFFVAIQEAGCQESQTRSLLMKNLKRNWIVNWAFSSAAKTLLSYHSLLKYSWSSLIFESHPSGKSLGSHFSITSSHMKIKKALSLFYHKKIFSIENECNIHFLSKIFLMIKWT